MTKGLSTQRLILRRFEKNDWEDMYEYLSDEEVVRFEPYPAFDRQRAKEETARRAKDSDFWAVTLADTGKVIGNLYFHPGDFDTWELGYVFNKSYWHMGYASESAKRLLAHAFEMLGAHRVIAMCCPENTASWRLMERLGMRREAYLLKNVYFTTNERGEPEWLDTYQYAILRSEWEQSEEGKEKAHPKSGAQVQVISRRAKRSGL